MQVISADLVPIQPYNTTTLAVAIGTSNHQPIDLEKTTMF